MMVMTKSFGVLSGVILLFLGPFSMPQVDHLASAAEDVKGIPCEVPDGTNAMRAEDVATHRTHMISGEVLHMEDGSYLVREQSGKEVTLNTDERTDQPVINQGDRIAADVDDQDYAVWIRSNKMTDRRTEHASVDCDPN